MKLRTVFMGSPLFAVPSLRILTEKTDVISVVCQPDKPAGRGLEVKIPAIKQEASYLGLNVLQPMFIRPSKSNFVNELSSLNPDLIVVVAYGKILPKEVLSIPKFGCWNIHGSILPKYRGAAPIQWSLIQGETSTGVTLMQMDEGMDTGPTFFSKEISIEKGDTTATLSTRLSHLGAAMLKDGLDQLLKGTLSPATPQNSVQATMAPLLQKEHGLIDFTRSSLLVVGQMMGVDPWPGAYTTLPHQTQGILKLFGAHTIDGSGRPGEVLKAKSSSLHIACGKGAIAISELQAPGKKRLPVSAFLSGFSIEEGTILGGGETNPLLARG